MGRRFSSSARLLVERMEYARRREAVLHERLGADTSNGDRDPLGGLHTSAYLERWVGSTRTSTARPLPLALVLVSVKGRESMSVIAGLLNRWLGAIDRAILLHDEEFLLVMPGAGFDRGCGGDAAVERRTE